MSKNKLKWERCWALQGWFCERGRPTPGSTPFSHVGDSPLPALCPCPPPPLRTGHSALLTPTSHRSLTKTAAHIWPDGSQAVWLKISFLYVFSNGIQNFFLAAPSIKVTCLLEDLEARVLVLALPVLGKSQSSLPLTFVNGKLGHHLPCFFKRFL